MKMGELKWFSMWTGPKGDKLIYPLIPNRPDSVVNQRSNFPGFLSGIDAGFDIARLVKVCQGKEMNEVLAVASEFAALLNVFADWQASIPPFSAEARGLQSVLDNIDSDMDGPLKVRFES